MVEVLEEEVEEEEVPTLAEYLAEMVQIERFAYTPMGTFGRLYYKEFSSYCVELPWKDNHPFISCIPIGLYPMKFGRFYKKDYPCWEINQVPNRSLIKIHIGNTMGDIEGCIAPGTELGVVDKLWAVLNSREAHKGFMSSMKGNKDRKMFINIHNLSVGTWSMPGYATVGG